METGERDTGGRPRLDGPPPRRAARLARPARRPGPAGGGAGEPAGDGVFHGHDGLHRVQGVRGGVQAVEPAPGRRAAVHREQLRQHGGAVGHVLAAREVHRAVRRPPSRSELASAGHAASRWTCSGRPRAGPVAHDVGRVQALRGGPVPSGVPDRGDHQQRVRQRLHPAGHLQRLRGTASPPARSASITRSISPATPTSAPSATTARRTEWSRPAPRRARPPRSSSGRSRSCASAARKRVADLHRRASPALPVRRRADRDVRRAELVLPADRPPRGLRPAGGPVQPVAAHAGGLRPRRRGRAGRGWPCCSPRSSCWGADMQDTDAGRPGTPTAAVTKPPDWHGLVVWDVLLNDASTGLFLAAAVGELAAPAAVRAGRGWAYPVALVLLFADLVVPGAGPRRPAAFPPHAAGVQAVLADVARHLVSDRLLASPDRHRAIECRALDWLPGDAAARRLGADGAGVGGCRWRSARRRTRGCCSARPPARAGRTPGGWARYLTNSAVVLGAGELLVLAAVAGEERAAAGTPPGRRPARRPSPDPARAAGERPAPGPVPGLPAAGIASPPRRSSSPPGWPPRLACCWPAAAWRPRRPRSG